MLATPSLNGQSKRMIVPIDTEAHFELPNGDTFSVDALELDDLVTELWAAKGHIDEQRDEQGNPKIGPDGKPLYRWKVHPKTGETVNDAQGNPIPERFLDWPVIEEALANFLKPALEGKKITLKKSHLHFIWDHASGIWQKKRESWHAQDLELPTSRPSSEPGFSD